MSEKPREWWLVHGKYGEHGWSGPNFPWDSRVHVVEASALDMLDKRCQLEVGDARAQLAAEKEKSRKLVEALRMIAGQDYRGNRPVECVIAYKALAEYEQKSE